MNKIIFSEKSSISLKNKSLTTCQYAAVFLKGILLLLLLAMFYLILLPVLAKAGLVPFHYEYTDNYHQFFTWSDAWCTGFSLPSDLSGQIADPLNGYLIYGILESILTLLPVMIVLLFVKRILDRTLKEHTPFTRKTEKDLRVISWILIIMALFKNTLYYSLIEKFLFDSVFFRFPDISGEILVMGILALILSEIFRYGIDLQDEADMTI